jgi:hypothetical protein
VVKNLAQPIALREKRAMSRNIAIALGISCIILLGALIGTFWYYTSALGSKNALVSQQQSQIADLQYQIDALNRSVASYRGLWERPSLKIPDLAVSDSRPLFGTPSLQVSGTLVNYGSNDTNQATVHVWAYQGDIPARIR